MGAISRSFAGFTQWRTLAGTLIIIIIIIIIILIVIVTCIEFIIIVIFLMFYRHSTLRTLDFTGSEHWALSIFLRAQPWICMHMCTLYICFYEKQLSELMRKENITFIYSVYIFYIKTTKQTDIQKKKNSKTTTTTTKDMYTNCNRKTQQCILIDQCPCICSQKGFFKLQTRKYSCNHWIRWSVFNKLVLTLLQHIVPVFLPVFYGQVFLYSFPEF